MHYWGDENVDWEGIEECNSILYTVCTKWGRIGGQIKEKWGNLRFYAQFSDGTLFSLLYPGYHWIPKRYSWFYFHIDLPVIQRITKYTGLLWLIRQYQNAMYELGYRICEYNYPHLFDEIHHSMDHPKLCGFTGGQFGWQRYNKDTKKWEPSE